MTHIELTVIEENGDDIDAVKMLIPIKNMRVEESKCASGSFIDFVGCTDFYIVKESYETIKAMIQQEYTIVVPD